MKKPSDKISASFTIFFMILLSTACKDSKENNMQSRPKGPMPAPIIIDEKKRSITFSARVNGKYLLEPSRHLSVFEEGSNGKKSIFTGLVDHTAFYNALVKIGAKPGDNMTMDNKEKTFVSGDTLEATVTWDGAKKQYRLDEVVKESNRKPILLKFGGNLKLATEKNTGCLICLDSCPVGIVSNASYPYGAVEKRNEVTFIGNKDLLPPDGTYVSITMKLKEK